MDTNWTCNLACRMCLHSSISRAPIEQGSMDWNLFKKIAREVFPRAFHVSLSCAAEPLLSDIFLPALRHVRKYEVPLVDFVTNGMLLDERNIDEIVSSGVDLMQVSIDSAEKAVFERIRRGADFERVVSNLETFRRVKEKRGVEKPALRISAVLMRSTIEGIEDLVRLAHRLGAEAVVFRHLTAFRPLAVGGESLFMHRELANKYIARARALADELKFKYFYIPDEFGDEESSGEKSVCGVANTVVIYPKGDVLPCEAQFLFGFMGNLAEQSFDEIWNSPAYAGLREDFAAGRIPEVCKQCPAVVSRRFSDPMAFQEITHPAYEKVIKLFAARAPFNEEIARLGQKALEHFCRVKKEYDLLSADGDRAEKIRRWKEWYEACLRMHDRFEKEGMGGQQ